MILNQKKKEGFFRLFYLERMIPRYSMFLLINITDFEKYNIFQEKLGQQSFSLHNAPHISKGIEDGSRFSWYFVLFFLQTQDMQQYSFVITAFLFYFFKYSIYKGSPVPLETMTYSPCVCMKRKGDKNTRYKTNLSLFLQQWFHWVLWGC